MSSSMRGRSRALGETSCNGIAHRILSIPRSILGGFSRVVNQGKVLIRIRRGNQKHPQDLYSQEPLNFTFQEPSNFPLQNPQQPPMIQEESAFNATFKQQHGTMHPFFYARRFMDVLKIARDDHKFMFMYIHSPEHPFTPSFCRETLSSDLVVQFLDANFVCWCALASRGEVLQMSTTLKVSTYPFCAVVAPAGGDHLAVVQQMEGPVSPAELVEILQRTMEEQGMAFGSGWAKQEEKRRADRRLREEQDVAALQIDQEGERLKKNSSSEDTAPKPRKPKEKSVSKQPSKVKPAISTVEAPQKEDKSEGERAEETQILNRFPNGERREHSFLCTDKIQAIYRHIDSLGLAGVGNYRMISNFPRKVFGVDKMGMSLKDAGLHPKASLFLELL